MSERTVAALLTRARAKGLARLDAQLLLAHRLGQKRTWLIAHDDEPLPESLREAFLTDCEKRADGMPLAYLLGEREFFGLRLQVNPAVLVPRPETELLVEWALEVLDGNSPGRVLDLGTGSGAIALALKHARPSWQITATDASAAALAVARANGERLGLPISWHQGDWWQAVGADDRFDVIVSNPPYVAGADPHLPALRHEPRQALTPEGDGLAALRAIAARAEEHLLPGGWLLMEHGFDQASAVGQLLQAAGFDDIRTRADLAGQPRCTGGRLSRRPG